MLFPRRNLNRNVPWRRLFDVLRVPVRETTLPAVLTCPLCTGPRLTIFPDQVGLGQWHYCQECGSHGDMIQLASRFWKLPIPATIFKLHDAGFEFEPEELTEEAIAAYRVFRIEYRERMMAMWKKARGCVLDSGKARSLIYKLRLRVDRATATNRFFPDLLGSADTKAFELEFFRQAADDQFLRILFRGGQWDRALVMPFFDRPFRISGFYFIGRDAGYGNGDRFFQHTYNNYKNVNHSVITDAGLNFHPTIINNKRPVIAISDPHLSLHINVKQLNLGIDNVLNLVTWYHENNVVSLNSWDMFRGRKLIFWMAQPDYRLFAQAIRQDALISTAGPVDRSPEKLKEYVCDYNPDDVVRQVENKARPWQSVFDEHVATIDDNAYEHLLLNLRMCGIDVTNVMGECVAVTQNRMQRVLSSDRKFKSMQWRPGQMIEERNDCWYVLNQRRATEYMLSNAVLQIDTVISAGEKMKYAGKIRHHGQVVEFVEDKTVIDRLGATWLENKMIEHRLGPLRSDRLLHIKHQLASIAKLMHEPVLSHGFAHVGWDTDARTLVTPKYGIKYGGSVTDVSVFSKDPPAADLPRPMALLPLDLMAVLGETEDHTLLWGVWCGLVANILAPAFNRETNGLAVVGGKAAMAGKIAGLSLGCKLLDISRMPETLIAREQQHPWPVTGSMDGDVSKGRTAMVIKMKEDKRNILLRVSAMTSDVLLCNGGWTVLSGGEKPGVVTELWEKLSRIFPAYMRSLLKRRFTDFRQHRELVDDVAADVTYWLNSEYRIESNLLIKAVKKLQVHRPGRHGGVVLQLLAKLVDQGRLTTINDGDWTRSPKMVKTDEHMVVSYGDINRALITLNVPELNVASTAAHMRGAGAVEAERDGMPLWQIPIAQWAEYSKPATSKLKIYKGA